MENDGSNYDKEIYALVGIGIIKNSKSKIQN